MLYLGLLGNVARFIYVSYLRSPWPVLPFELLQGKALNSKVNLFKIYFNLLINWGFPSFLTHCMGEI